MFFEKARKSDRFQIIAAVLFMGLFAALLILVAAPRNQVTGLVCNIVGNVNVFTRLCSSLPSPAVQDPGELVVSRIISACVDSEGLQISVLVDEPLSGVADVQVFSTGPDFFPSEQGMTDTYEISRTITDPVDQLDLVIPVDSMPVGEKIFGNIIIDGEGSYSQVAYSLMVSDCSTADTPPSHSISDIPTIQSAACLPSRQLMIAFEFERPVFGQYQALVDGKPYQLASIVSQPALLFFSGEPPLEGPIVIRLVSATDEAVVLEETYTPPVCGGT